MAGGVRGRVVKPLLATSSPAVHQKPLGHTRCRMTVTVCWTTVAVGATTAGTDTPRAAPRTEALRLLRGKDGATTGEPLVVALLKVGLVVTVRTIVYVTMAELV